MDNTNIYFKQVQLLLEVIPFVNKEECFALKGGTAINMFIRDMPRLSVDIDLMYLPVEDRNTSLKNIADAFERIAADIERTLRGSKVYRIYQRSKEELSKLQVERNGVRIKIETSPVMRGTVRDITKRKVSPKVEEVFGFAKTGVVHLDDLYAGKLCAALDRQHPRDFFDVRGLLDNEGITDSLMDVFMVYLISSNQPITKLLRPNFIDLKQIFEDQFVGMTAEVIDLSTLEQTREELVRTIHEKMTDKHKEFLVGVKKGTPDWSLLPFENISELPSIKWKLINLDKMGIQERNDALKKLEDALSL
ncbi:MAG: nucleotidyl transferase AbiEii/AbiGii toxin family protein [Campylobacterales bacterium]|nr:nucleotidyl transferase AbiEii/AbiGii toxin family protein [Campylobacterales bacterium]